MAVKSVVAYNVHKVKYCWQNKKQTCEQTSTLSGTLWSTLTFFTCCQTHSCTCDTCHKCRTSSYSWSSSHHWTDYLSVAAVRSQKIRIDSKRYQWTVFKPRKLYQKYSSMNCLSYSILKTWCECNSSTSVIPCWTVPLFAIVSKPNQWRVTRAAGNWSLIWTRSIVFCSSTTVYHLELACDQTLMTCIL